MPFCRRQYIRFKQFWHESNISFMEKEEMKSAYLHVCYSSYSLSWSGIKVSLFGRRIPSVGNVLRSFFLYVFRSIFVYGGCTFSTATQNINFCFTYSDHRFILHSTIFRSSNRRRNVDVPTALPVNIF